MVLEYAIKDGLEIERPIQPEELPESLKQKYINLKKQYDTVYIEKVFTFRKETVHEFYCYKDKKLTKFEI